jgi:Na+-driven multidrug efflux pump
LVDLAFVGRLGRKELDSAAIGNLFVNCSFLVLAGFLTCLDTLLSTSFGASI